MRYVLAGVAAVLALSANSAGVAATRASKSTVLQRPHRQIADCMIKRMSASKNVSYNDAAKLCKESLRPQGGQLTASNARRP